MQKKPETLEEVFERLGEAFQEMGTLLKLGAGFARIQLEETGDTEPVTPPSEYPSDWVEAFFADQGIPGSRPTTWTSLSGNIVLAPQEGNSAPTFVQSPARNQAVKVDIEQGMTVNSVGNIPIGTAAREIWIVKKVMPGGGFYSSFGSGQDANLRAFTLGTLPTDEFCLDFYGDRITGTTSADGEWHTLAGVYDGSTATLLVDNVVEAQKAITLATGGVQTNLANSFSGITNELCIGAVLVFDRVLSGAERAQLDAYLRARYITDTVAPILTAPVISAVTDTTLTVTFNSDEAGQGALIVTTNQGKPSAPQIEQGRDVSGATTAVDFHEPNFSVVEGANSVDIDGLTPGETYYIYTSARDGAGLARVLTVGSTTMEDAFPAISGLGINSGHLAFTSSVAGTVYYYFDQSTAKVAGATIKTTALAETPDAYGSFAIAAGQTTHVPDWSGLSAGNYVLHMTVEATEFAVDPAFQVEFTE